MKVKFTMMRRKASEEGNVFKILTFIIGKTQVGSLSLEYEKVKKSVGRLITKI